MSTDKIIEIGIDAKGRLYLRPENEKFTLIYRSATEVHWDKEGEFLYSPKPRDWTYLNWYKQIISVVLDECGCGLVLTDKTKWVNVPDVLRLQIEEVQASINNSHNTKFDWLRIILGKK